MLRMGLVFFSFFLYLNFSVVFAMANEKNNTESGKSRYMVTNNTDQIISLQINFTSSDQNYKKNDDWDGQNVILQPFETKTILWFNRITHVKPKTGYHFNISTRCFSCFNNDTITVKFDVYGKDVLGSYIYTNIQTPTGTFPVFHHDGISKKTIRIWEKDINLFARTWLAFGNVVNDFHLVLDNAHEPQAITTLPEQISVLSYNTQLMPLIAGTVDDLNQPHKRAKIIAEKINNFDVVVLQELFDVDLRNILKNKMKAYFPYQSKLLGENNTKPLSGGVMIFSKWPILNEYQIVYAACDGWDCLAAKGAIYAAINKQGKIYHVIGTHLQADKGEMKTRARQSQLQELSDFTLCLDIPSTEPVIFAGDFNLDEFNGEERELLTSSLQINLVKNRGYRYSHDNMINTMSVEKTRSRIDYVVYSLLHKQPLTATNEIFILRDLNNESMWPKFDLSDHFPVASFFEFKN